MARGKSNSAPKSSSNSRKSHPMVPRAGVNKGRTYPYGGKKSNN